MKSSRTKRTRKTANKAQLLITLPLQRATKLAAQQSTHTTPTSHIPKTRLRTQLQPSPTTPSSTYSQSTSSPSPNTDRDDGTLADASSPSQETGGGVARKSNPKAGPQCNSLPCCTKQDMSDVDASAPLRNPSTTSKAPNLIPSHRPFHFPFGPRTVVCDLIQQLPPPLENTSTGMTNTTCPSPWIQDVPEAHNSSATASSATAHVSNATAQSSDASRVPGRPLACTAPVLISVAATILVAYLVTLVAVKINKWLLRRFHITMEIENQEDHSLYAAVEAWVGETVLPSVKIEAMYPMGD